MRQVFLFTAFFPPDCAREVKLSAVKTTPIRGNRRTIYREADASLVGDIQVKGRKSSKSAPSWTVKPSMDEVKDKIFLTYEEAAVLLGVSARTVWGLVNEGEIPHIKLASAVRIRRADLDAWAEAKATASRGAIKPNRDAGADDALTKGAA